MSPFELHLHDSYAAEQPVCLISCHLDIEKGIHDEYVVVISQKPSNKHVVQSELVLLLYF